MTRINIKHIINIKLIDIYNGYNEILKLKKFKIDYDNNYSEEILTVNINLNPGFDPRENITMKGYGNKI